MQAFPLRRLSSSFLAVVLWSPQDVWEAFGGVVQTPLPTWRGVGPPPLKLKGAGRIFVFVQKFPRLLIFWNVFEYCLYGKCQNIKNAQYAVCSKVRERAFFRSFSGAVHRKKIFCYFWKLLRRGVGVQIPPTTRGFPSIPAPPQPELRPPTHPTRPAMAGRSPSGPAGSSPPGGRPAAAGPQSRCAAAAGPPPATAVRGGPLSSPSTRDHPEP